ncbi:hypothetical protein ACFQO4_16355 [Saliphagus sp. GCM10025334]
MSMTRTELAAASDTLREAANAASADLATRLEEQAETVADLAERATGPDHGRLARLEHSLRDIQRAADENVSRRIDTALEEIRAYRETVEGV